METKKSRKYCWRTEQISTLWMRKAVDLNVFLALGGVRMVEIQSQSHFSVKDIR